MKKIIVLDDDRFIGRFIKLKLEKFDYQVNVFENPEDLYDSNLLDTAELLLLDINLSNTKGTEVLKKLKSDDSYHDIPVIMITGEVGENTMEFCFREGAYDYITKPLSDVVLRSRIDSAINQFRKFKCMDEAIEDLKTESNSLTETNQKYAKKINNLEMYHQELSETTQHLAAATWRERKSKEELNNALTELQLTKEKVEESNQKLVSSINYAQKIQTAFLPANDTLLNLFSEHFMLFKPRDIVSGDFYWSWSTGSYKFIGVFDCTGHGVPGAFLSLIGMTLLKEIVEVKRHFEVDQILKHLDAGIIQILNQDTTENHDGMDASLICIDEDKQCLYFSGAHHPLLYFKDDELITIKGSRSSIGGNRKASINQIECHKIPLEGITEVYLLSDGFQDQFGGESGRKLGISNLSQFLETIHQETMEVQKEKLDAYLYDWMHTKEVAERQIDDITLLGIRPNL